MAPPAVDRSTIDAVRAPAKSDVLAVTGLTDGQWNKAIDALLADGTVTRTGAKHGTRYHLKDQDEQ